jgi:hypothetical protein
MIHNEKTEKNCNFICEKCQYISNNNTDYKKHILTRKHIKTCNLLINPNEKTEKNCQFICEKCNFITKDKHDYKRHLMTQKHANNIILLNNNNNKELIKNYLCDCGKRYKHMTSLCFHKKKCNGNEKINNEMNVDYNEKMNELETVNTINTNNINTNIDNHIILELVKQNQEFKKMLIEQNDKIIELSKTNSTINNNNINNNCHNKTKFNLNFFLNEQCKDALNIMDFVNDLQVKLTDLENVGKLGYTEGISQIFINGLKQLDVFKRPIHCSDLKREVLYIKDQDAWEKENEDNKKIKKAINQISHKNIHQIPKWIETNPNCSDSHSTQNNEYLQIVSESMGSVDQTNINKIIRNISKEVVIGKE